MTISRRDSLTLASASIAAASIPIIGARAAVTDVPTANVKPLDYKLEKGAELRVLRPAKFIDPDEVYWRENTKKYTAATGVPVRVDFISWEDIRPQTAVVANTGAGPDIVVGFSSDPQIYASKIADMTDLADYLGAKYGGWQELSRLYGTKWNTKNWISIPIGGGAGPVVYRQSWVKEAGYDKIPDDHQGFLTLCQKLHAAGHPFGMSLGHALGDANGFANWLLWSHNAMLVDLRQPVVERFRQQQGLCRRRCRHDLQRRVDLLFLQVVARSEAEPDRHRYPAPGPSEGPRRSVSDVGDADERHGFQAHQVSERRQGLSAFHDGGGSIRPLAVQLHRLLVELPESLFQDEVLVGGSETGPLRRRHGYAVLRRLQGTGDPGILGGDGELYRGRYVRHGRHRQRDAGERGQTWRPASRSLLQDLIVVPGPGATLVTAGPKRYA
jgi:hypothetical protein